MYEQQTVIEGATVVPIVTAILGAVAGWAGGRITKQIEFRFDLLQKLTGCFHRTRMGVIEYAYAINAQQRASVANRDEREAAGLELERRSRELQSLVGEVLSYNHLVEQIFPETEKEYQLMLSAFLRAYKTDDGGPDSAKAIAAMKLAQEHWDKFAGESAKRCGFVPFKQRWLAVSGKF